MRAFLATTCVVFGLLVILHIWRLVAESNEMARDPWFWLITLVAAALSVWAGLLLRRSSRST